MSLLFMRKGSVSCGLEPHTDTRDTFLVRDVAKRGTAISGCAAARRGTRVVSADDTGRARQQSRCEASSESMLSEREGQQEPCLRRCD
jgi:hypothetical protein